ncbi:hypothetical protein [Variovorax sp. PMC12]|uniref:hypothetical protein n=1 Tax=Variovorax sp. PMC12 TaxID=2126319 RepID=UPI000D12CA0C|nr:hypothetical protein [Variovorax sp. PMC12]AVQ80739.1 hypothetical protein C4F17_07125 [Variovorax sp. PMC12]
MLLSDVQRTLDSVSFPGYEFTVEFIEDCMYAVYARFKAPCTVRGGEPVWQYTRKWLLESPSEGAVVGTCLKLVLTSLEHEAREMFLWKGKRVFDPHTDINALLAIQR